ncbi:hypothetical protein F2P79_008645, partial [Pimephales promelas]
GNRAPHSSAKQLFTPTQQSKFTLLHIIGEPVRSEYPKNQIDNAYSPYTQTLRGTRTEALRGVVSCELSHHKGSSSHTNYFHSQPDDHLAIQISPVLKEREAESNITASYWPFSIIPAQTPVAVLSQSVSFMGWVNGGCIHYNFIYDVLLSKCHRWLRRAVHCDPATQKHRRQILLIDTRSQK